MICDKATPGFYCSRTPGHEGPCAAHIAPTNSAVAARHSFDGYGFQYIDNGSGSDWRNRHPDGEFLYGEKVICEALTLMKDFCARVERGEVRSQQTYAKFKIFIAQVEAGEL